MSSEWRRPNADEAAAMTGLDVSIVWHYADLGLISPSSEGYTHQDLAELRCVRRLRQDLALEHEAIEIILRMRRRTHALLAEVRALESARQTSGIPWSQQDWLEAEWTEETWE